MMPLINANDPAATATHVIEHGLGDFEPNPEPLQTGCPRSTKIVHCEPFDRSLKSLLGRVSAVERSAG
jgi:hypothetical protein